MGKARAQILPTLVMAMLVIAFTTASAKLGSRTADEVILRAHYGADRVVRDGLRIVNTKPTLKVSNGDELRQLAVAHFGILLFMFLAVTVGGTALAMKLLPRAIRRAVENGSYEKQDIGWWPVIALLPLAGVLALTRTLWPNAIVVVAAVIIGWCGSLGHRVLRELI